MTILEAVGRRRRMERAEMAQALASAAVPLANGYVEATTRGSRRNRALAWVQVCRGITLVSVGGTLRDGYVRYDEPGSMHPMQMADITFASERCVSHPGTLDYLRRHARRVVVVDDPVDETV